MSTVKDGDCFQPGIFRVMAQKVRYLKSVQTVQGKQSSLTSESRTGIEQLCPLE